jgi:L-aspartate oxidase
MYDVLVIGAGIAGLTVALKAAAEGARVLVLSKTVRSGIGSTNLAQGGIATVTETGDSFESHFADTLEAGDGLCKPDRVHILTEAGPATIHQLEAWGVQFSRESGAKHAFQLALEGGHSHRRILHAADLTGKEIMRALLHRVSLMSTIEFLEEQFVEDLALAKVSGISRCVGAWVVDRKSAKRRLISARATVLCTGGCGKLWLHSTNPPLSTGDGIAIAHRAGAILEDLEFMQFHPTSLFDPHAKQTFLISEAVRGFGGILKNDLGEEIMNGVHPLRSLAPRDIVARAIHKELARTGKPCVWLDVTHRSAKDIRLHFPNIYKHCLGIGIDIAKQWIPVVPAAHYMCGGVRVDSWSRSSVPGLYASGEVAATGVHGANRLASNSLLESVVYSVRAWTDIKKSLSKLHNIPIPDKKISTPISLLNSSDWNKRNKELQALMWSQCGIVRTLQGLEKGIQTVTQWKAELESAFPKRGKVPLALLEFRNRLESAAFILRAAHHRRESRGLHYLLDCPEKRESLRKHYSIKP